MRSRRYEFQCEAGVVWTLVYKTASGKWFVEKQAPSGSESMTIEEFEQGPYGALCGAKLDVALLEASNDL
jgi:hypothetical protein